MQLACSLRSSAHSALAHTCVRLAGLQVSMSRAVIGVFASQIANLFESYIGATLQDKPGYEWVSERLTVL